MNKYYFIDPSSGEIILETVRDTDEEAIYDFESEFRISFLILKNLGKIKLEIS